jgi:hypothetical protein
VPVATSTAAIAALPRPDLATHGNSAAGMAPGSADQVWLPLTAHRGTGRMSLAELARIWPAAPGTTLADEDNTPAGTDLDLEPGHGRVPPPHPLREGHLARERGDPAAAERNYRAALRLLAGGATPEWEAAAHNGLGFLAAHAEDLHAAESHQRSCECREPCHGL